MEEDVSRWVRGWCCLTKGERTVCVGFKAKSLHGYGSEDTNLFDF